MELHAKTYNGRIKQSIARRVLIQDSATDLIYC